MRLRQRIPWILALLILAALLLPAQRDKGKKEDPNVRSVEGVVLGLDQRPVPGAIVQLKDTRTLQIRSFVTQQDGTYRFAGLRTDIDYEIQASYQDLKSPTRRLSTFDTRKVANVVLPLEKK
jgi:hypothetical protein